MDALSHKDFGGKMKAWKGVKLNFSSDKGCIEEFADYASGYARSHYQLKPEDTFLLVLAAKKFGEGATLEQTVANIGILWKYQAKKMNGMVYGVWTDGRQFKFLRIDRDGKVWVSAMVEVLEDVCTWLHYVVDCALKAAPTTTPATSSTAIFDAAEGFTFVSIGEEEGEVGEEKFDELAEEDGTDTISVIENV
ncbi:hypothetical protein HK104_010706 [Borealophlyctis nickersoniae]|nr:hypothetical protein HK104_010706 [Borealophlyctis nickersoniae]